MTLQRFVVSATLGFLICYGAQAQENRPLIISERVQEIALEFPVAERLGIEWDEAGSLQAGQYLGLLASAEVVAREIALQNDREVPQDEDYRAAFAAFCFFPPNKPPLVEEYWEAQMAAFHDQKTRDLLVDAVGELAVLLPAMASERSTDVAAAMRGVWPDDAETYFQRVWNAPLLLDR